MTLMLRIWGPFAPEGSPERDYFNASTRYARHSVEFENAAQRLAAHGCPPFQQGAEAKWDGEKWHLSN